MHLFPPLLFSTLLYFLQCLETRKAEPTSLPPGLHTQPLSVPFISTGKAAAKTTKWLRWVKRAPHQAVLIQVGYLSAKCTYFFSKLAQLKRMIIAINDYIGGFLEICTKELKVAEATFTSLWRWQPYGYHKKNRSNELSCLLPAFYNTCNISLGILSRHIFPNPGDKNK